MKIKPLTTLVLTCVSISAQAATINWTSFDANGGDAAGYTVTKSHALDGTVTYSFTRTANLDGGTVNDTLSFDLVYKMYTGSTFAGGDVTLGTQVAAQNPISDAHYMNAYVGDADGNQVAAGDSFTMTVQNLTYSSGEGFTSPTLSFNGFTSIKKFGGGTADVYLGTTGATTETIGGTGSALALGGVTELTMTASANSNQRWRDLAFSITVPDADPIPEPTSAALIGLGISSALLRRRRS